MNIQLNQKLEIFFYYIVLFLPILFIFGSAIINILIVFLNIIFLIHIINSKNFHFINENRVYIGLLSIYLLFQIINNIINENYIYFDKSIYYLRLMLLPLIFKYFSRLVDFNLFKISKIYLVLLFLIIIDLFYQYTFDVNLIGFKPGLFNAAENLYERYSGVFNQELVLGGYLSSLGFLMICLYYLFNNNNKYTFLLLLGILFISIALTGERSSLINFMIAIFFIFLFIKDLRKHIIIIGTIAFLIFIIGIKSSEQLRLRYFNYPLTVLMNERSENATNPTIDLRLLDGVENFINNTHWGFHYKTAYNMFLDKPINGHGFRQFRIKCKNYSHIFKQDELDRAAIKNGCSTHPHHYILEILSEQGIIGFILFLTLIIYIIKDIFKITNHKTYNLILLSIILGYILPIKPTGSIISTWFSSIFWLMLSFSYIKNKNLR